MSLLKFKSFNEFIESVLSKPSNKYHSNTQLLLEFTVQSNKEEFLGGYIKYLIGEKNVFVLLITQEGNSTFYTKDVAEDYHLMVIELTVLDSSIANYEFKKFGQIPMNENKILFAINSVVNEIKGKYLLIIFDSLTDLIFWHDFTIIYKFMRKCVSNLHRVKKVSSIFLINETSHSHQELSAFETLFDGILVSKSINECSLKGPVKYRYLLH